MEVLVDHRKGHGRVLPARELDRDRTAVKAGHLAVHLAPHPLSNGRTKMGLAEMLTTVRLIDDRRR
jgi:hypothetical protein